MISQKSIEIIRKAIKFKYDEHVHKLLVIPEAHLQTIVPNQGIPVTGILGSFNKDTNIELKRYGDEIKSGVLRVLEKLKLSEFTEYDKKVLLNIVDEFCKPDLYLKRFDLMLESLERKTFSYGIKIDLSKYCIDNPKSICEVQAKNLIRMIKAKIDNELDCIIESSKSEKNKFTNDEMMNVEGLLEILEAFSLPQEDTSILAGIQHDRVVEAVNNFISHHSSLLGLRGWSDVIQGLHDPGVDAIWQCSKGGVTLKLGIQVKSHRDFSNVYDSFRRVVLSQISDSHRINLKRLLLFLGADLSNPSQKEKARGITSDVQQMQDNYVVTISPEKVAGLWRWNERLNVSAINQMKEAGYPWLTTVYDTIGNVNQNSWGKDTGGNWTQTKRTVLYVGEEIGIRAIAMSEDINNIQFRFSVQPSGGSFQTRRDWDTCEEWKWLIQDTDIGRGVCVMVSVRCKKEYYQFQDSDDYTYAIYDILPRKK
jgi:hypothetical protein